MLVFFPPAQDPRFRLAELGNRCFLARHQFGKGEIVVGIALSEHVPGVGSASDLIYLNVNNWSPKDDAMATRMKDDLGYFAQATTFGSHEDEYPPS